MPARFPLLQGFAGYKVQWLGRDAMAGLAIAAVAIPSAIAYPAIAGLPPEVGVYASIFPLLGYALLGPSHRLIVGPDAATMTVLAAVLAGLVAQSPTMDRVGVAALLALIVGVMCVVASALRLGAVAAFLSRPILIGFIGGIAISIMVGQISRLTGLKVSSDGLVAPLVDLAHQWHDIHWPTLALGLGLLALTLLLQRLKSPVPGPLVVVVLGIAASALFDFEGHGIKVVGALPQALPSLSLPSPSGLPLQNLLLGAGALWLVSFSSGLVAARSFGAREGFPVDANRELIGFGGANFAAGLFSGFPVTVSDSRTAINLSVGGRSQMAGLVAAAALASVMLYLNDALRLLPSPALGAILVAASIGLLDFGSLRELWRISRMEFAFALIGMWGAISLGVLNGVIVAVAATLIYVLIKEMRPHDALLGRRPGRPGFYKLHRFKDARPVPGLTIFLIQGSLLFFNVDYVRARLQEVIDALPADTRWLLLDASAVVQLDSTAAGMLDEVRATLAARGVAFGITELHNTPMTLLERAGVIDRIGENMMFDDIEEAAAQFSLRSSEAKAAAVPTPSPTSAPTASPSPSPSRG
ncbi:SulP family inorganic anion transporter [Ancylobacter sonchi]|uniref:SulP family inorganic anion transporter n=1 Tax=Ancylobacter sonchi TaxID=1937790 RepID=UPI001BD62D85|nr:SulP family inorganic anion transporter [Ancylobacter sonchi]MBS7537311.1 SulP family inorganic anion transporter [Ancylobacter sonchi]